MFKSRIKILMEQKGFTLRSLSGVTSLSLRTINKARTDAGIAECRLSTLKRIAVALGVGVTQLFDEVDGENN